MSKCGTDGLATTSSQARVFGGVRDLAVCVVGGVCDLAVCVVGGVLDLGGVRDGVFVIQRFQSEAFSRND